MSRVVHFEIHASNPQTLIPFYAELFGWKFENWGSIEYWQIETGTPDQPGINGGLLPRRGPAPVDGQPVGSFVCTVQVESLDDSFAKAQKLGASVAMPKMPIPGIGWLAYVKDPDGNLLGMMQPDPNAK
jgi:predicted enzyme related to lactoylglutathione lyase